MTDQHRAEIVRLVHRAMNESYLTTGNQREKIAQDTADAILTAIAEEGVGEDQEDYELGKRDGYESAVQDIDLLTGGNGEYCSAPGSGTLEIHCPTPDHMKLRIKDRFEALRSALTGRGGWRPEYENHKTGIQVKIITTAVSEDDPEGFSWIIYEDGPGSGVDRSAYIMRVTHFFDRYFHLGVDPAPPHTEGGETDG